MELGWQEWEGTWVCVCVCVAVCVSVEEGLRTRFLCRIFGEVEYQILPTLS